MPHQQIRDFVDRAGLPPPLADELHLLFDRLLRAQSIGLTGVVDAFDPVNLLPTWSEDGPTAPLKPAEPATDTVRRRSSRSSTPPRGFPRATRIASRRS